MESVNHFESILLAIRELHNRHDDPMNFVQPLCFAKKRNIMATPNTTSAPDWDFEIFLGVILG